MRFVTLLAAALLPLIAPAQPTDPVTEPESCPPLTPEQVETLKQEALTERRRVARVAANVGVDALGRVLVAVDVDRDGLADEIVLFTAGRRLEGPWSQLVSAADYEVTRGTLRLEAADRTVALALAVGPAEPPSFRRAPSRKTRVVQEAGVEFVIQKPGVESRKPIEGYDHALIESWPPSFARDFYLPATHTFTPPPYCFNCGSATCQTGGCYATGCGHDCTGIIADDDCQINCQSGSSFACCNCTNGPFFPVADCRCLGCRRLRGPIS